MARYYDIQISAPVETSSSNGFVAGDQLANSNQIVLAEWSSYPNGVYGMPDPGALLVEMDLYVYTGKLSASQTASTVTIHGISLADIQQNTQFGGNYISIYGGMGGYGLPLTNPSQAGLLMYGYIINSYANWVGTEMDISFVFSGSGQYTFSTPGNLVFTWLPGQSIQDAIAAMLLVAFPNYYPIYNIVGQHSTSSPVVHFSKTWSDMVSVINSVTSQQQQPGITLAIQGNNILVYDVTSNNPNKDKTQLNFTDLIGQPKWVGGDSKGSFIMQFITVMRADIQVGSIVKMPAGLPYTPGAVSTTAGTNPLGSLNLQAAFQGEFIVQSVRHIGNSRDPQGASWCSVFEAVARR